MSKDGLYSCSLAPSSLKRSTSLFYYIFACTSKETRQTIFNVEYT